MPNNITYQPKRHIAIIESARGFAALYVLLTHVIELTGLHNNLATESWLRLFIDLFLIYGHQAVLLFFVLSGFSIHYTSADRQLTQSTALKHYYYLRWRRIYPIFVMAVLITISLDIAGTAMGLNLHSKHLQEINIWQLIYTFSFLTDVHDIDGVMQPVLHSNGPLWSLSYEVFYYLIYPLYWMINRRFGLTGALTLGLSLSVISFAIGKIYGAQHFLNVMDLYVIWCLGAVLAEMHRRHLFCKLPLFMHASAIYVLLQSAWVLENATYTIGAFFDITWGLLFFFIMLLYLNKQKTDSMKHWHRALAMLLAVCGYLAIVAVVKKLAFVANLPLFYSHITLTLVLFGIGLYLPRFDIQSICNRLLKPAYHFGKSSYGIYVLHYPMLLFVATALPHFGLSTWWCILFVPAILYAAWFTELHYQPFVLRYLDPLAIRMGYMQPGKTNT